MKLFSLLFLLTFSIMAQAQDSIPTNLPYHQIPDYPEEYSAGTVMARMIDGLGYRYYWATKSLSEEALAYQPSADAGDMMHTLEHIFGLTEMILNGAKGLDNVRPSETPEMSYQVLRTKTLLNIKEASEHFYGKTAAELTEMEVAFARADRRSSFPMWNLVNGPIADAIYHTGQIVSFRRTAGNPIHPGVSVFSGKTRE